MGLINEGLKQPDVFLIRLLKQIFVLQSHTGTSGSERGVWGHQFSTLLPHWRVSALERQTRARQTKALFIPEPDLLKLSRIYLLLIRASCLSAAAERNLTVLL